MTAAEFDRATAAYSGLRITVVGDFCLDRYFDIDPARSEISIETGLPVHNVTGIRCFPGASGTIVNNLAALGAARIWPVGMAGDDGEGWELRRALSKRPGVSLEHFITSPSVHTFTYSKPLLHRPGLPPEELSRLDLKNWTSTPEVLQQTLIDSLKAAVSESDAVIVLDQVDAAGTGVVGSRLLGALQEIGGVRPDIPMLGDSRRSLADWPPMIFKMNARELGLSMGRPVESIDEVASAAAALASRNQRATFVTLAERGIVGALPDRTVHHVPAWPVRGPIDIVGAGDAVTANLTMALTAGVELRGAMELAMAAASHVIHQLGTTGTASVEELRSAIV